MNEMKQFLYKIQPSRPAMLTDGPTSEEGRIVSEHFNYLKDLTEAGTVLLAGRTLNTDESSFGIVILQATDEAAAKEVMLKDPAVKKGVMLAEFYPYRVALMANPPGRE
jgi:uncharacterized protein YciI